jgi:hypothetical protein
MSKVLNPSKENVIKEKDYTYGRIMGIFLVQIFFSFYYLIKLCIANWHDLNKNFITDYEVWYKLAFVILYIVTLIAFVKRKSIGTTLLTITCITQILRFSYLFGGFLYKRYWVGTFCLTSPEYLISIALFSYILYLILLNRSPLVYEISQKKKMWKIVFSFLRVVFLIIIALRIYYLLFLNH